MRRFFTAVAAALALAACTDTVTGPSSPEVAAPRASTAQAATWTIFTSEVPEETLDASPGWEVATQFRTSKEGKVIGFRFWRADGETGTNTGRLWTESGTELASATFPSGGTGWQEVYLSNPVSLATSTNYLVSVNTNTAQVKTFGYLQNNPITNGPLTADFSYYGQPTGSMPTSGSYSIFFVDVIFEEEVPLPNLYIGGIYPGSSAVTVHVCNDGTADVGVWTLTRFSHRWWDSTGWEWRYEGDYSTQPVAAGSCVPVEVETYSNPEYTNQYEAWADVDNSVAESNEDDNYGSLLW